MKINSLLVLVLTGAIAFAPVAFATGLNGLKYVKERQVKLKSGKVVTVMVAKMNGKMMVVVPMEDMNDIFERAEGHSMSD